MQKLPENLYLAKQARELDRIAIEEKGISGISLMQKAGTVVFKLILQHYPASAVTIFCGTGNNAGDGYIVAKLALQAKIKIEVFYLQNPLQLQEDALLAYQDYIQAGGTVTEYTPNILMKKSIIVDALFGTGLNRNVSGSFAEAITLINDSKFPVISVDIPSGLNADTGDLMGCSIKADYTVCFIVLKQGMFTGFSAEFCGQIIYDSLDIPKEVLQQVKPTAKRITQANIPKRHRCAHKGNNGHVLVIGGDFGFSGAIRLTAEAALRVGAGLVSIATRKSHAGFITVTRPELMCHGVEKADELLPLIDKASVIVIGPGLGVNQWGQLLFKQVLASDKPKVLDADALNLLANHCLYYDNWILTPHPGEAARLLGCSTSTIANNRFNTVSKLQKKYGGIVLLKGAGTLIDNGHEIKISTTGNPGMASGGMGDVLSGIIAGLVAQNLPLNVATNSAVYIHGQAADLSTKQKGEIGLLASDLLPFIRTLVNE